MNRPAKPEMEPGQTTDVRTLLRAVHTTWPICENDNLTRRLRRDWQPELLTSVRSFVIFRDLSIDSSIPLLQHKHHLLRPGSKMLRDIRRCTSLQCHQASFIDRSVCPFIDLQTAGVHIHILVTPLHRATTLLTRPYVVTHNAPPLVLALLFHEPRQFTVRPPSPGTSHRAPGVRMRDATLHHRQAASTIFDLQPTKRAQAAPA